MNPTAKPPKDESIDCIDLKRRIQEELRAKWGKTPWVERNRQARAAAAGDAFLARHIHPSEPDHHPL